MDGTNGWHRRDSAREAFKKARHVQIRPKPEIDRCAGDERDEDVKGKEKSMGLLTYRHVRTSPGGGSSPLG